MKTLLIIPIILILSAGLFLTCKINEATPEAQVWTVQAGQHGFQPNFTKPVTLYVKPNTVGTMIQFTESCRYQIAPEDQAAINKLYGLSYGKPHWISLRWGFAYNTQKRLWDLYAYYYLRNTKPDWKYICSVDLVGFWTEITNRNGHYIFTAKTHFGTFADSVAFVTDRKLAAELEPYFGGNRTAPHKMDLYFYPRSQNLIARND